MEAAGASWVLVAFQLVNFALIVASTVLAVWALVRLSRSPLSAGQRLGFAALALLVPVLGPLAVLLLVRPDRPEGAAR
jgi:hypothetical protein